MPAPIVDYGEYRAAYTAPGHGFGMVMVRGRYVDRSEPKFHAPTGNYRIDLLTDAGRNVLREAEAIVGLRHKYRGVSKVACYFKWERPAILEGGAWVQGNRSDERWVRLKNLRDAVMVAKDRVMEMGYEGVTVETGFRNTDSYFCKGNVFDRSRPAVEWVKLVINHPE